MRIKNKNKFKCNNKIEQNIKVENEYNSSKSKKKHTYSGSLVQRRIKQSKPKKKKN